jgi:hypothetical protein
MEFVAGVVSSLVASILLLVLSRTSLRRLRGFPRGVQLLEPVREEYTKDIASQIRTNSRTLFFKGLTGYDLFSSEHIQSALTEIRTDGWEELVFVLTDPSSPAFHAEPSKYYTAQRLSDLQQIVVDFLDDKLIASVRPDGNCIRGVFHIPEERTMVNLLVLDNEAIIFFRGFTPKEGPSGQVIVKVNLTKCSPMIKELITSVKSYYIERCKAKQPNVLVHRVLGPEPSATTDSPAPNDGVAGDTGPAMLSVHSEAPVSAPRA